MSSHRLPGRVKHFQQLLVLNEVMFAGFGGLGIGVMSVLAVVFFHVPGWWALIGLIPIGLLIRAAASRRSVVAAAQRIETGFPVLEGRLVPAVQLASYQVEDRQGYSLELARAAVEETWLRLQPLPVERLVDWRRTLLGALILVIGFGLAGSAGRFAGDRLREGWYWSFAPGKFPLELSVTPGAARVEKGQNLTIGVRASSPFQIRQATVEILPGAGAGAQSNVVQLASSPEDQRVSAGTIDVPVKSEFDYRVRCLGRTTATYHVGLKQPLEITSLTFKYHYPAYARIPDNASQSREIAALVGTRVEVKGEADQELKEGKLVFGDSLATELQLVGKSFTGRFTIRKPAEFDLRLTDVTGTANGPEHFRVTPIADEYPLVRLFSPGMDMNLPVTMKLLIGANSVDDYGLTSLTLSYVRDSVIRTIPLKSIGGRLEDTTLYMWDLSKVDMMPGTSLQYYVTVFDNDAVSGPKSTRSETYTLKFPTLSELYRQATDKTAAVESLLTPMTEQQKALQEQTQKLDDAMRRNRGLSWEEQQSLKNVMQNQDSMLAAIQALREDVRKAMDQMFQSVAIDSEAMQGLRELDTLLSQVLPKEMLAAMDSLRKAMEKSPQNMKIAMQKFKYSQEDMQKAIERAVDLLQRLRQEQEMNALVRKAEELAAEQEKIQKNSKRESNEQLARREDQIKQGIDSLARRMDELGKDLKEKEVGKDLQDAAQQMESDSLSEQAQSTQQDYQQGNPSGARQKGQKLQKSLQSLSDKMKKMKAKMKEKRSQDVAQKLMRAADDLLTLSDAQEGIEQRIDKTRDLSDLVGEEKRLGDASRTVAETLAALSMRNMKVPPQLGQPIIKAMKNVDNASQALESNSQGQARGEAQAMRSNLNNAVEAILQTMDQAKEGGGFGGGMESMMEQLSQALGQQMGMGQEMGGMLPMPMPGGMSGDAMAQWQDLMARQQALREALERMMQGMGGQKPGLSSNVDAAIEEMKQLERDMAEMNPQRPYLERNERIVNKLLDAQRSIRQREYTEKRESETGKQFTPPASPRLPTDLGERKKLLREELMRALKEEFPREYEPMVRAYFDALLKQ
jgi:hypothetical protein